MRRPVRGRSREPVVEGALREVVDGMVACPRRGRVDIIDCFLCPESRGLSGEHEERVVCAWTGQVAETGRR